MKFAFVVLAILFFAVGANGQEVTTHGPTANLSWTASVTPGVTTYAVYRAPCTGTITNAVCSEAGKFAIINKQIIPGVTYVDSTVVQGQSYDYYVISICPSSCFPATSAPSNHFAVTIPKQVATPPEPPTNLTINTTKTT